MTARSRSTWRLRPGCPRTATRRWPAPSKRNSGSGCRSARTSRSWIRGHCPAPPTRPRCCTYARWSEPMSFRDACIPVRLGWSSPFARWQGPLAEVSSLDLATRVATDALARFGLPAAEVTGIVLGWTVPQPEIFYGASTVAARIGAPHATGAMLSQACATSAACLEAAALRVEAGLDELSVVITTDRTSNGPVLTYP